MDMEQLKDQSLELLKADGKVLLAHQLELLFGPAAELALSKLKEAIPGEVDDMIIDMVGPKVIELLRAELDKALAKI